MKSWRKSCAGFIVITQIVIEKLHRNNHMEDLVVGMRKIHVKRNRMGTGIVLHRFMKNGRLFRTSEPNSIT